MIIVETTKCHASVAILYTHKTVTAMVVPLAVILNTKCHRFALFKLKSCGTSCLITTHPPPRLVFKVSVNLATLSIFHLLEIQKAGPAMQ